MGWEAQRALLAAVAAHLDPRTCVTAAVGRRLCRRGDLWRAAGAAVAVCAAHLRSSPCASAGPAHGRLDGHPGAAKSGVTRDLGWPAYTRSQVVAPLWLTLHLEEQFPGPWHLKSSRALPPRGNLARLYRQRMWIEEMYGDMKPLGIQIPDTQIQDAQRIPRLMLA